jgi:hypothetical protein
MCQESARLFNFIMDSRRDEAGDSLSGLVRVALCCLYKIEGYHKASFHGFA